MFQYSKLAIKTFILTTIVLAVVIPTLVYISDPLQVFHKSYFTKEKRYAKTRESIRAIVRDNDFDGLILGSSFSVNFSAKEVGKKLGNKYMNLSMCAGTMVENALLLNHVFKEKEINDVLYTFSSNYMGMSVNAHLFDLSNYDFLYSDNIFERFKIYGNTKYSVCAITFSQNEKCVGEVRNMDKPYAWDTEEINMKRFGGFDVWLKNKDNGELQKDFKRITNSNKISEYRLENDYNQKMEKFLDDNLFKFVRENPNVKFRILIAPVTNLHIALLARTSSAYGRLVHFIASQKKLVEMAEKYKNVTVYGFQNDNINEIKNYKDLTHYHPDINSYMLNRIQDGKNILTLKNVDEYFKKVEKTARTYNYDYYRKQIIGLDKSRF